MGEIKISYAELENKILELREVRSSWGVIIIERNHKFQEVVRLQLWQMR